MALLEVKNLSIGFRHGKSVLPVVSEVSCAVGRGEVLALVGESGCGKSISCLALTGLLPPRLAKVSADRIDFELRSGDPDNQKIFASLGSLAAYVAEHRTR